MTRESDVDENAPALLLVKLVAHTLGQLAELALRLSVVGVDHQVLQVPEAPAEVLESLALLEETGDLGADLATCKYGTQADATRRRTFHVIVNESASPKLLKGTKDLFPCKKARKAAKRSDERVSGRNEGAGQGYRL